MATSQIVIKGAREHNLRSVDLTLPRNQLICLTGVSGSGKSSLAFDTLYAEGQRRYVESLSTFARQFLGQMPKPEVDLISGLSPSISISQKSSGLNPRSTVGTITEIYDYLRVLFARVGVGHCPSCHRPITAQTREQILARIAMLPRGTRFSVLAPIVRGQKGEFRDLFDDLRRQGFVRARVDGQTIALGDELSLDRQMRHDIEVVIDRLTAGPTIRGRLAEAVELALRTGDGNLIVAPERDDESTNDKNSTNTGNRGSTSKKTRDKKLRGAGKAGGSTSLAGGDLFLSAHYACTHCDRSFEPPSPQMFSFNSPRGMCTSCDGLGEIYSFDPDLLVTWPDRSLHLGCMELIGSMKELGRWRRHIYHGVAETLERVHDLEPDSILRTAWKDLPSEVRNQLLWGTGELHITFTWRHGSSGHKYGGKFEGIIPELLTKYRNTKSRIQRRQLERYMRVVACGQCAGARLNEQARSVTIASDDPRFADNADHSLPELCHLAVDDAIAFFAKIRFSDTDAVIAEQLLKEIRGRLGFLENVGLGYLTLDRTAPTLSGGESQRIRLAGQIGCGLVGVLYVLDEPSIGLHPRDNDRLLGTLTHLRDQGNTVVVVEHDEDTMRAADHIVDFGPGPGVRGGEVVAVGGLDDVCSESRSVTGQYLNGERRIAIPDHRRPPGEAWLKILAAEHNNLKRIDAEIPLGLFVCITGVSGSGKSSLVNGILVEALRRDLNGGLGSPGQHAAIEGLDHLDKLIAIDQSPIGRTPRSNPATYIKVLDDIRRLYTQLPESKARGYKVGRFSFNVSGGRCEACEGNGSNRLEMDFLADVWVTCPVCEGHRFNRETLQIRFKGKSIADVLELDVQQALDHFENIPQVRHKLQTLHDVGLDYLKLGQPSPTLSGGEAQRVKLARELVKKSTGRTLYLLDEPTTGLHFADIHMLLDVLHDFVAAGNTVLVVEHNLDVIKAADWIIDLGPEGGAEGGRIVAAGTPEQLAECPESYTGRALARFFARAGGHGPLNGRNGSAGAKRTSKKAAARDTNQKPRSVAEAKSILVRGASQHNLKHVDLEIPRDRITVCCGPSGSGKSSLAMDTIYAEGQRRYVESLSSYARQFVGQMQKPRLEHIEGLSPAIAIEQRQLGHTPRSTVGTVTEIYDYLRILFARLGTSYCPDCEIPIGTQSADEVIDKIMDHPAGTRCYLTAPIELQTGQTFDALWAEMRTGGYVRVRIDGHTHPLDDPPKVDRRRKHQIEVVIDRLTIRGDNRSRVADSVENALALGRGMLHVVYADDKVREDRWRQVVHSQHLACDHCGRSFERLAPHNFSFNSSLGWCPSCDGLGTQTGANPAALLDNPRLTLAEGAVALWPSTSNPLFAAMLKALSSHASLPIDVPYADLSPKQRRTVLYGCDDEWIEVPSPRRSEGPALRFQYKGLYPALEEASRLSPSMRGRLEHLVDEVECSTCGGSRLRDDAAAVRFADHTLDQICRMPLGALREEVNGWKLDAPGRKVAGELVREVRERVGFLVGVGLDYLSLARGAATLSGGEAQRIRLASQVGSGLTGVLYVLDEPTIGLHPRDNRRLLDALYKLRDLGNTLLMVEHDREVIAGADQLLDFGPAAGEHGGQIVASGTPDKVSRARRSVTGPYLAGRKAIAVPTNRRMQASAPPPKRRKTKKATTAKTTRAKKPPATAIESLPPGGGWLEVIGARHNNLCNIDVRFPLGTLTVVTGVSGSGKSSLVHDVLYNALAKTLHRASALPAAHDEIRGIQQVNKVIRVDQQALGNTPTSNPATYTGVFDLIRALFAQLPESKLRGYTPRRFSFNVPGGRCDKCEGNGQLCIEMHFLPDVWIDCDECQGHRYNAETLAVHYHGRSIADVLEMPCGEAVELFGNIPKIRRVLQTLCDVGLEYIRLGQPAPTLSGGEAQRVKLAAELARPDTGRTLYLLDEPTTGLHFDDMAKLLDVLNRLVDLGNTVVVIEHNLDVIKTADWVIDMGPEAGLAGGQVVVAGTPEQVVAHAAAYRASEKRRRSKSRSTTATLPSHTGDVLAEALEAGPHAKRPLFDPQAVDARREGDLDVSDVGRDAPMPWEVDGRRWHTKDRVARNGQPCRWEGKILARVVDHVAEVGEFAPVNWGARTIVEITGPIKSDGWFLHAVTGEEWLLTLKFRVAKKTFSRDKLIERLALVPLNDLPDLPVYGNDPRVQCKNLRGPWQEVQLKVHTLAEIDGPEFWSFLEEASAGFQRFLDRKTRNPEDVMPWKVLGRKWHFSRKGFPLGKKVRWNIELLEQLCESLSEAAPDGQFLWNNQQVVHYCLNGGGEPWATIYTKRPAEVELQLAGPKDAFALGRVASLASEREVVQDRASKDLIKLKFRQLADLSKAVDEFLHEHVVAVRGQN